MVKQFIINYIGGKYLESKKNINYDDFNKYTTIIEPFGGSFGFSRHIYLNDIKNNIKRKFIIIDSDKELIDFYNYIKNMNLEEIKKFYDEYNEYIEIFKVEKNIHFQGNRKMYNLKGNKEQYLKHNNKYINYMFFMNCLNSRYKHIVIKTFDEDFFNMIKYNCIFYNGNSLYLDFINSILIRENLTENYLFYLDPPYLNEYNGCYKKLYGDLTENIHNYFLNYENVYFVHKYNYAFNYILKNYIYKEEDKSYQMSKDNVKHITYFKNKKFIDIIL